MYNKFILYYNLKNYQFIFNNIEQQFILLKQLNNLSTNAKQIIDNQIADYFIQLRSKFYDALIAIDDNLYESIKDKADCLQTHITNIIFYTGINLTHQSKFDELVIQKQVTKTEMMRILFNYREKK